MAQFVVVVFIGVVPGFMVCSAYCFGARMLCQICPCSLLKWAGHRVGLAALLGAEDVGL